MNEILSLDVTQDTDFQFVVSTTCYNDTTEWSAFRYCTRAQTLHLLLTRLVSSVQSWISCIVLILALLAKQPFSLLLLFFIAEKESLLWM